MRVISEREFKQAIKRSIGRYAGKVWSVTGPGRSGAVASVYASHYLGISWIPFSKKIDLPEKLQPTLLIDTARHTGRTLRKAERRIVGDRITVFLYDEPPIVRFFYESKQQRRITK